MKKASVSIRILLLLLFAPALVYGQENRTAQASARPTSPPSSSGLVNDWLRFESSAAKDWDIGGQVRGRFDVDDNIGRFPDSQPDSDFIRNSKNNEDSIFYLREKLHVGYQQNWIKMYFEGRDSSTFGDDRVPNPFEDHVDLHQAYLTLGDPSVFPVSLKVGRQTMSYGDERFVEVGDWNNLERTFDAAKIRYENSTFWVDAFTSHYVLPDNGEFNGDNWHDIFSGVYASTRALIPKQETDLYFFAHNVDTQSPTIVNSAGTGTGPRDVYTVGLRMKSLPGHFNGWDYGTEIAGQFGNVKQAGIRAEHRTYAADVMGGYTWQKTFGKPRVGLDFTYGSGDSNAADNKHETFDLLFGAAHKFYGIMDVTGLRNTINPSVNFSIQPLKKLTLRSDFLMFWLADTHDLSYAEAGKGRTANGYGVHPGFSSFFGSEIDLVASYSVTSFLSFQGGYGHFFAGDYVKESVNGFAANGGVADGNFFFLMTTFKF